ncbi:Uncharacterised protein [Streptococcus parasanguinis]|uniref:hypothetical protein n=1 Tax=Streptococcus parasanguinis TaxID=1318 RepID=UPI001A3D54F7|nr:hypothetical protein [Streptococcus parasanguinis]VTY19681.1 Uncharacterised protein [Streptococcus parasanguinis]
MNDVANTNKGEYELIENNLLAFNLFKSEEDKKTTDIFAISSPFEYALPQLIDNNTSLNLANIIDINGEPLFNFVDRHLNPKPKVYDKKNDNFYELDFASLSEKTKKKLENGTFKVGNSKKINGNYRAVIVDTTKNNVRVEDVTLKKVEKKSNNTDDSSRVDLSTQVQLKQIYDLLLDMKASQEFQINWDRNNSILPPFFSARTKVLQALNTVSLEEKIHLLNEANTYMEDSVSAIKADLISNKEEIIKRTKQVDYLYDSLKRHADFILNDTEIMTKIVGMQLYIDLSLNNKAMALERLTSYNGVMELLTQPDITTNRGLLINLLQKIPRINRAKWLKNSDKISLLELINSHYKYGKNDIDLFINLQEKLHEANDTNNTFLTNLENKKLEIGDKSDVRESN